MAARTTRITLGPLITPLPRRRPWTVARQATTLEGDTSNRAAIAVLPSTYGEGVPKALLEAAACGRAIVVADMPGCREAVKAGENGLVVPPHDVDSLAAALAALAGDPPRRQAMGRAGRALVEREFGDAAVARDTLALYQALLHERRAMR